jgi:hypothetical protein
LSSFCFSLEEEEGTPGGGADLHMVVLGRICSAEESDSL